MSDQRVVGQNTSQATTDVDSNGSIVHESYTIHSLTDTFTDGTLQDIFLYLDINEPTERKIEKSAATKTQLLEKVWSEYTLQEITGKLSVTVPQTDGSGEMTIRVTPYAYLKITSSELVRPIYASVKLNCGNTLQDVYTEYANPTKNISGSKTTVETSSFSSYPIRFKLLDDKSIEIRHIQSNTTDSASTKVAQSLHQKLADIELSENMWRLLNAVGTVAVAMIVIFGFMWLLLAERVTGIFISTALMVLVTYLYLFCVNLDIGLENTGNQIIKEDAYLLEEVSYLLEDSVDPALRASLSQILDHSQDPPQLQATHSQFDSMLTEHNTATVTITQQEKSVEFYCAELDRMWTITTDSEILSESQITFLQEIGFENIGGETTLCYSESEPESAKASVKTESGDYLYISQ